MAKAPTLKNLIKTGFGLGIGMIGAQLVFLVIGAALFIPGFLIYRKEAAAKKETTGSKIGGVVMMVIGALIMGGLGFGLALEGLMDISH